MPASLERTWRTVLEETQLEWACNLVTTQRLRSDFDPRPYAGADLVVIDEAHRLRRGGTWFNKAIDLVTAGARSQDRRVLLLTATPVNTGIQDLVNLLRVLTKNDRGVWAPEIPDFERYLDRVDARSADPFPLLDRAIVRRSRSDVLEAYENARAAGQAVERLALPERRTAHIDYHYDTGGEDLFERFAYTLRSLALAPYDLERFARASGDEEEIPRLRDAGGRQIGPAETLAFRPGTLAALLAVGLLTRFQSSLPAVRHSLRRLDAVLRRFGDALAKDPPRLLDLQGSPRVRALLADESSGRDHDAEEEAAAEGLTDEELERAWEQALAAAGELEEPEAYRLDDLRAALEHDRDLLRALLDRLPSDEDDGKVDALLRSLTSVGGRKGAPGLKDRRVLLFTQFRDTARYLHGRLTAPELSGRLGRVALTDGAVSPAERARLTAFFDPDRAGDAELTARAEGEEPPRILVSTDVLAEGHNLQLADTVVNFDLHFNPQVAVQRAGRVDRLNSPHDRVWLVSMLPPEALDRHIGLLGRLDERFRRIHGLGLGDERTTPLTADVQGKTLEQIRRLYADDPTVLDEIERSWTFGSTDYMRIPLAGFLNMAGQAQLADIPMGVSSVKRLPADWPRGEGVFIALAAPAPAGQERETYWRFYARVQSDGWAEPVMDDVEIFRAIACHDGEPRAETAAVSAGTGVYDWELIARGAGAGR